MSERFWDKHAEHYDPYNARYTQANTRILELTKRYCGASDKVLDIGCGTGIFTTGLAHYVKSILAVDLSEKMLETAQLKAQSLGISNITWKRADIATDELGPQQFDVINIFNVLGYIRDPKAVIRKIHKLLKPHGRFISVTDCLGEGRSFYGAAASFLGRIGVLPRVTRLSSSSLLEMTESSGFHVVNSENCYPFPPNFFIAAQKAQESDIYS